MREIKFRYVFERKTDGHIWILMVPLEALEEKSGQLPSVMDSDLWDLKSRDQYTGIKGNDRVEIYEGDILKWTSTHRGASGDEHIDVMEWDDITACFMLMPSIYEPYAAEMEVIGNIHANGGLLK